MWGIVLASLCFIGAMALPLAMPGWRSLAAAIVLAAAFFAWVALDLERPGSPAQLLGSLLGGVLLVGFAAGAIARSVALLGKRPEPPHLKR